MKIGFNEDYKNELFKVIQDSYFIDIEFVNIKGGSSFLKKEVPTIQNVIQRDRFWICVCGETTNPNNTVKCFTCKRLRKIESFNNILTNPMNCLDNEIELLNQRRQEEKPFLQLISSGQEEEIQYALDSEWFNNWKFFVTNDISEKPKKRLSQNQRIGVLPPGPISNNSLFDKNAKEFSESNLKKGLKKNVDYMLIAKNHWKFLVDNYRGGPEVSVMKGSEIYKSKVTKIEIVESLKQNNLESHNENTSENEIESEEESKEGFKKFSIKKLSEDIKVSKKSPEINFKLSKSLKPDTRDQISEKLQSVLKNKK